MVFHGERAPPSGCEAVHATAPSGVIGPSARREAGLLEATQRRVDRAVRKIKHPLAALTESFGDRVAVGWTGVESGEQKQFEMTLEFLTAHRRRCYT